MHPTQATFAIALFLAGFLVLSCGKNTRPLEVSSGDPVASSSPLPQPSTTPIPSVTPLPTTPLYDIDLDGVAGCKVEANLKLGGPSDCGLIQTFLFNLSDADLVPFISPGARRSITEIRSYLNALKAAGEFDIDGDGLSQSFTDGNLLLGYWGGLSDSAMQPFLGAGATRSVMQVRNFLYSRFH